MAMFDFPKYYDHMAHELPNDCKVVEVGVANGDSVLYLAKKLKKLKKRFTLYMVDDLSYGGKDQLSEIIRNVIDSKCADSIEIMPFGSLDASCRFNDNSLDLVFIDSGHTYELTKAEIKLWYAKIKVGAVLSGHDYFSKENKGVRLAVDEMLPKTITRPPNIVENSKRVIEHEEQDLTITKQEIEVIALDKYKPEKFLFTEDTDDGNGVFWCKKSFYFKP